MGGGNCLFGIEDKTTPTHRGNVPIVEVASGDTNPTIQSDTGVFYSGALGTAARFFDVLCIGKCKTGISDKVKLDVQPASQIPDFFTKNSEGRIVFAAPQVVGTVKAAKGHNSWVQVELKNINGDINSDIAKHACLGIKKNDENGYFDIIHAGNLTSRYIDVTQESYIELVPLISKTSTKTGGYVDVTPGDKVAFTDITIPTIGSFNFGSVYRVNVSIHDGQWVTDQKCDLGNIRGSGWDNYGRIGVGSVTDQNGDIRKNYLFAINRENGTLAYSSNGVHWTANGIAEEYGWDASPIYGNGIWCAVTYTKGVKRSINGGETWSEILADIHACRLEFSNGIFMVVTDSTKIVYTSSDAEIWSPMGNIKFTSIYPRVLIYGDNRWICGSVDGYIYQSKDGKIWEQISDGLHQMSAEDGLIDAWYGGCYANGYFYVIHENGLIAKSCDGVKWKRVFDFTGNNMDAGGNPTSHYFNITYYKNKLWAFDWHGQKYTAGLFNPDDTIESLEN